MEATAVRERPILFSAPMVRAILAGKKTQTRRVVKPQPDEDWSPMAVGWYEPIAVDRHGDECPGKRIFGAYDDERGFKCPHGGPGDRLWVRETWGLWDTQPSDGPENATIFWKASHETMPHLRYQRWRPSIHMPRWASRILLEITDVRVQRLQEISDEDAIAEGIEHSDRTGRYLPGNCDYHSWAYHELWNQINGAGSWESNPFAWAISFKRLEPAHA